MNFVESSAVFRRSTALFNSIQQNLGQNPRKWDSNEMGKALVRLEVYADVLHDLVGEMNTRLLNGESEDAPKLLAAATLLTNHIGILRNGVSQGMAVLQGVYQAEALAREEATKSAAAHTVGEAPPEGVVPARAPAPSN